jgi:hypothetical protein
LMRIEAGAFNRTSLSFVVLPENTFMVMHFQPIVLLVLVGADTDAYA